MDKGSFIYVPACVCAVASMQHIEVSFVPTYMANFFKLA